VFQFQQQRLPLTEVVCCLVVRGSGFSCEMPIKADGLERKSWNGHDGRFEHFGFGRGRKPKIDELGRFCRWLMLKAWGVTH
jgi:hypothetical protein